MCPENARGDAGVFFAWSADILSASEPISLILLSNHHVIRPNFWFRPFFCSGKNDPRNRTNNSSLIRVLVDQSSLAKLVFQKNVAGPIDCASQIDPA
jgi:hypothetical protein